MSLGIFDSSHEIPLASEAILSQEDEIIDTFLNITLPSLHSNALSSRDDAFVNDESTLHSDALSSRDDALVNNTSTSTFDPVWIDVENMSSNNCSTSCYDYVNVVYVSAAPQRPKRLIIYLTPASSSPKMVFSINVVVFDDDSPYLSKAPSYRVVAHTYENSMNKQPRLLQEPKPETKAPSDYDLVEKLQVTLVKISLWELL